MAKYEKFDRVEDVWRWWMENEDMSEEECSSGNISVGIAGGDDEGVS